MSPPGRADDTEPTMTDTDREWNAEVYDRLADPQREWGRSVMARLELRGDETVLDAGCGVGGLTAELLERLPHGHVIAIDASERMADRARARLVPRFGGHVEVRTGDLAHLELDRAVDVVFSNAVFHHIADHDALFAGIFRALVPDGRLVAQCGGGPNLTLLAAHVADAVDADPRLSELAGWPGPWNNADATTTQRRLEAAGFVRVATWVSAAPVLISDAARMREHLETINLRSHLARLPDAAARAALLDAVVTRLADADPAMTLDHWRLNMAAVRPPSTTG